MTISIFSLFTIGIGPSSSHTVGPMRAAKIFAEEIKERGLLKLTQTCRVELFGSLGLTGKGHGTDKAILMGLCGETPEQVEPLTIDERVKKIKAQNSFKLLGEHEIHFEEKNDLIFQRTQKLPFHPNGILPGGLKVKRRAPDLYQSLTQNSEQALKDPLSILDWVNLYGLAVNEENAAGGRVVTAPTNGAAGIIPAVLHYFDRFSNSSSEEKIIEFLLTAGAIGILYKRNASLSGAEVGCQGEVGVAYSMAAAGLAAVLGGTNAQIENAAEIGMEHNLGLTCDPIGGLVQIPCIECNAMASMKAINAARIALCGDGTHKVSLDKVIQTMMQTGLDMQSKYKETSKGGLAINVVEC